MKLSRQKRKRQSGSSMVETLIALILLCLLFFGAMQIFQWAMARMFCDYSSYYAAKALSYGYAFRTVSKVARLSAIPISGPDEDGLLKLDKHSLHERLLLYMATGNAGVSFPYWDASGKDPDLRVSYSFFPDYNQVRARVTLRNAPYLSEGLGKFLRVTDKPVNPSGESYMIDHSTGWSR